MRRVLAAFLAAFLVVGCGSSAPSAAPATSPPSTTPFPAPTSGSSVEPSQPAPSSISSTTATAACEAIGLRKTPSITGQLVARIHAGDTVRVVGTVAGDAYTVGACGVAGSSWYKIDRVNGKKVKTLYGVSAVYSASGLYK